MSTLSIRNLSKDFGALRVLHDIVLDVDPGEFVALVGPSGCGKSTLLSILAGLESATEGEVEMGGRIVNSLSPKDRNIAMVFQNYALYPTMSVRENMTFSLSIRGASREEKEKAVARVSKLLDIEALLDRKPSELSGGQRQRVAMGRALVRDPSIFLFDEPLSNLDAKLRVKMRTEIKKLHKRLGITTVYVTHDQTEAMTLATRIAVMHSGRIQQYDKPQVIYREPANVFVATFIGSLPMNVFPVRLLVDRDDVSLVLNDGQDDFSFAVQQEAGRPVTESCDVLFGIRAEHITIHPKPDRDQPTALVDVIEPLGAESLISLKFGNETIMTSIDPDMPLAEGDRVGLAFDVSRACLFDPETQLRRQLRLRTTQLFSEAADQ